MSGEKKRHITPVKTSDVKIGIGERGVCFFTEQSAAEFKLSEVGIDCAAYSEFALRSITLMLLNYYIRACGAVRF